MATRVTITKALEAKLRKGQGIEDVLELVDEEYRKREAGSKDPGASGLGYKELVSLLRSHLGDELLTPPKPNTAYIVRIVNRAKEQGVDYTNVEQIVRGVRRLSAGRGPYRLADIVYRADECFAAGADRVHDELQGSEGPSVFTGRPVLDQD